MTPLFRFSLISRKERCNSGGPRGRRRARKSLDKLAEQLGGERKGLSVNWSQDGIKPRFTWLPDKSRQFLCSIPCSLPLTMTVSRRRTVDRLITPWVARAELGSSDPRFDQDIRVATRDLTAARQLLSKQSLRAALRAPLDRGFCRVIFDERGLSLRGHRRHVGGDSPEADLLRGLVSELAALSSAASSLGRFSKAPRRHGALLASWVAVITVLLIGVVSSVTAQIRTPLVVHTEMLPIPLTLAALALPLAWLVTARMFGGHSAPERMVLGICLSWLVALPLSAMGLAHWLDGALDESSATVRIETVVDKFQRTDDKGNVFSRVVIRPSWRDEARLRFQISNRAYDDLLVGRSRLAVPVHPGAFDWEWHEPVKPIEETAAHGDGPLPDDR